MIVHDKTIKPLTRALCLTFALVSTSGLAQSGTDKSQADPYTLRVASKEVILDVVVTDKRGGLVKNLSQSDFAVFDNRAEQRIAYFNAVATPSGTPSAAPCKADCVKMGDRNSPVTILVVDENTMTFEDEAFANDSLGRFLSRQSETLPQPTMLASVQTGKLEVLHEYTTSKQELLSALKHRMETSPWRPHLGDVFADQVNTSLSALVALAESAMGHAGRKNVVWVGRGFPAVTPGALDPLSAASLQEAVHTCIDLMTQARMSLYTIDPRGLTAAPETNENGDSSSDPLDGQVDFARIAKSTGGRSFAGRNDVDTLIATSTAEGENFYSLGYRLSAPSAAEQAFHSTRVVMRNPQWKATTRSGYYTIPAQSALATSSTVVERDRSLYDLDVASRTTLVYDGVPFQMARGASNPDLFTLSIPASAIRWKATDNGEETADIYVLAESFDRKGNLLHHTAKLVTAKREHGSTPPRLDILTQIPTASPAVRLRFAVRLEATGRVGANNFSLSPTSDPHATTR